MAEQWLSIVEYARATGTSDMTIRRRIRTGKILADLRDGKYFIAVGADQAVDSLSRPHVNNQTNNSSNSSSNISSNRNQSAAPANAAMKNRHVPNHSNERATPAVRRADELPQANHYQVTPNYLGQPNVDSQISAYSNSSFTSPSHTSPSHTSRSQQATNSWNTLPGNLTGPLVEAGMASVEARTLIEFCDRALNQASTTVQAIEGKFSARIEALTAQLNTRAREISILNQQIEDLQLLVQILERKKVS